MNNLISVIIPFYNNSGTIERCLQSIEYQSLVPLEVIIINDKSPDWNNAEHIIEKHYSFPITVLHHNTNKNGAAARNTGIRSAKGDFIAFLDADDEWLPMHLESSFHKIKTENSDITYSQARVYNKYGVSVMPNKGLDPTQHLSDYLFVQGGVMFTPTLMVKKTVAQQILFNEKLRRHQDYDFLLRCEAYGASISFIKIPNVNVHWEENDPKAKGGTWDFSLQFAQDYAKYFTSKSFSCFILKNSVLPLLMEKNRVLAFKLFYKYISPLHLSKLNYYFILSYTLFGKFKHPFKWKK